MSSDTQFLEESLTSAYDESARGRMVESGIIPKLVTYLSDDTHCMNSLEILFLLSLHVPNQKSMANAEGLATSIKKLMARGRLKQKKVAMATWKNIQPFLAENEQQTPQSLSDLTNQQAGTGLEAILNDAQPRFKGGIPRKGNNSSSAKSDSSSSSSSFPASQASSFSLFVENMNNSVAQKKIESCLLHTPGVVSFLCDSMEEKVVIRATSSREQIIQTIYKSTQHRASLVKGQYNDFKPGGYLDNMESNGGGNGEDGWGTYLWQIIAKTPKQENKHRPQPQPQTPQQGQDRWFGWW